MLKYKTLPKLNKSEQKEFNIVFDWFSLPTQTKGWGLIYTMNDFSNSLLITLVEGKERIGELVALKFNSEKNKYYGAKKEENCYELHLVGINEKYRGKGYGKTLISKTLDLLKKQQSDKVKVFIQVHNGNKAAKALYSKYFREVISGRGAKMIEFKNNQTKKEITQMIKNEDTNAFSFVVDAVKLGWDHPASIKSHMETLMVYTS